MKFKRKPVEPEVIEAFRYNIDPRPDWFQDRVASDEIITYEEFCVIQTPFVGNLLRASIGDWIILNIKGELYPLSRDLFEEKYEAIT